jgi:type VI protein secretion system component VasK
MFVVFVQPSAAAIGPAGAPFMNELLGIRKLADRLIGLGIATVIGGLFLYWRYWDLLGSEWLKTAFGTWITIGSLAAIAALTIGIAFTRPRVIRLLAIGRTAAEAGGPTPEQGAEIGALQSQLRTSARISLGLIFLSMFAMATARYW